MYSIKFKGHSKKYSCISVKTFLHRWTERPGRLERFCQNKLFPLYRKRPFTLRVQNVANVLDVRYGFLEDRSTSDFADQPLTA